MRVATIVVLSLGAAAGQADIPSAYPVQLSSRDRTEISRVACVDLSLPDADLVDASKARKTSSLIRVNVRCGSHRAEGTVPVAHLTKCANAAAKWSCEPGYDALIITPPGKESLTVVPDGMPMPTAASLIREVIKLTVPPFHTSIMPLLVPACSVRAGDKAPFKEATLFQLTCTNSDVEVTRDCGTRPCRHFVVKADPRPAPAR